ANRRTAIFISWSNKFLGVIARRALARRSNPLNSVPYLRGLLRGLKSPRNDTITFSLYSISYETSLSTRCNFCRSSFFLREERYRRFGIDPQSRFDQTQKYRRLPGSDRYVQLRKNGRTR